jgi:hypothetical protein
MNKLKLHVIVVTAAASAVGVKPAEAAAIKEKAWADSGLETKQDRAMFDYQWHDESGVCAALAVQKLPSEAASEKHESK